MYNVLTCWSSCSRCAVPSWKTWRSWGSHRSGETSPAAKSLWAREPSRSRRPASPWRPSMSDDSCGACIHIHHRNIITRARTCSLARNALHSGTAALAYSVNRQSTPSKEMWVGCRRRRRIYSSCNKTIVSGLSGLQSLSPIKTDSRCVVIW